MVVAPYRSSTRWQAQIERTPKATNKVTTKEGEKRRGIVEGQEGGKDKKNKTEEEKGG